MLIRLALAAAVSLATLSGNVMAQETPLPAHFPIDKEACFGRVYDTAHLARNPRQRVTAFHLFRDLDPDQNTEDEPITREEILKSDAESKSFNLSAYVRFRNRKGLFWNVLNCNKLDGKGMRCGIDCDGGNFDAQAQQKNLIVSNNGFILVGGCGASDDENENRLFFSPGADDKTFRLEPLPVAQCTALRESMKPAFARMGPALRVRFAKEEAACFTRTYDDAHLKQNPQQKVRRIAMLKAAGGKDVHKDAPGYDLTFRIETRDGKKFSQTAKCFPDRYTYTCPVKAEDDTAKDFYVTRAGDNAITIRDRRGKLASFFNTRLGEDDRLFKLEASAENSCTF